MACLVLVILSGAAFISWSLLRATTSYRKGNYPAATAAWQRLSALFPDSAGITFNNGVTLYRQREYRLAAELFTRAGRDPLLKAAAEYNLGNCLIRRGDDLVAGDQARDKAAGAAEFYRQAIVRYEQAAKLDGADPDTKFNLASARNRLLTLRDALQEQSGKKPGPGVRHQEDGRAESRQAQGKPAQGNRDSSEAKRASTGDQAHDTSSATATQDGRKGKISAKPLRMSRKDAEALLQEHLQTGGMSTFFRNTGKPGHPFEVLKDW